MFAIKRSWPRGQGLRLQFSKLQVRSPFIAKLYLFEDFFLSFRISLYKAASCRVLVCLRSAASPLSLHVFIHLLAVQVYIN